MMPEESDSGKCGLASNSMRTGYQPCPLPCEPALGQSVLLAVTVSIAALRTGGIVADDHAAVRRDAAPQRAVGGNAHG